MLWIILKRIVDDFISDIGFKMERSELKFENVECIYFKYIILNILKQNDTFNDKNNPE